MTTTNPTTTNTAGSSPSPLYTHLHALALSHALPQSVAHILSIRHPSATHAWGHARLVRQHPLLGDVMDNAAFARHLATSGRYIASPQPAAVRDVVVDEVARRAVVVMSYFLCAKREDGDPEAGAGAEVVENEVVWTLRFSGGEEDVGEVRIVESVEFIDAGASARLGTLVRGLNGGVVGEDVRGGLTLTE